MPVSTGILALIKDSDATNAIPAKDAMCYKRGDFVELFPPGTVYVVPPAPPFLLLDVTGVSMTVDQIKARYQQMVMEGYFDEEGQIQQRPIRRRLYYVNLDTLPTATKNALANNRFALIAWNKLHTSVTNKTTGATD